MSFQETKLFDSFSDVQKRHYGAVPEVFTQLNESKSSRAAVFVITECNFKTSNQNMDGYDIRLYNVNSWQELLSMIIHDDGTNSQWLGFSTDRSGTEMSELEKSGLFEWWEGRASGEFEIISWFGDEPLTPYEMVALKETLSYKETDSARLLGMEERRWLCPHNNGAFVQQSFEGEWDSYWEDEHEEPELDAVYEILGEYSEPVENVAALAEIVNKDSQADRSTYVEPVLKMLLEEEMGYIGSPDSVMGPEECRTVLIPYIREVEKQRILDSLDGLAEKIKNIRKQWESL